MPRRAAIHKDGPSNPAPIHTYCYLNCFDINLDPCISTAALFSDCHTRVMPVNIYSVQPRSINYRRRSGYAIAAGDSVAAPSGVALEAPARGVAMSPKSPDAIDVLVGRNIR